MSLSITENEANRRSDIRREASQSFPIPTAVASRPGKYLETNKPPRNNHVRFDRSLSTSQHFI